MRKTGFTLAEVLITLVIIGVIAAITIPNLMQKYKKHQVEVQLKEAYSILNNALKMAQAEYGVGFSDMVEMNGSSNENFAKTYLIPYLKVTKTCNNSVSVANCKMFKDGVPKAPNGYTAGVTYDTTYMYRFSLSNGMFFGVRSSFMTGADVPKIFLQCR